ncbi:MAG: hypothetical protein ACTHOF_16410 [Flavisolibacter sp.]|jgi:hypothetical protein
MKKHIANTFSKVSFLLILVLSLTTSTLFAADGNNTEKPALVKYVGTINDQVVFQLSYDNKEGQSFYITVKDADGIILYNGKFNEKNFSKQFRFYKSELGNADLLFTLTAQNEKQSQTFKVATTSRIVEEVVVTKL